MCICTICRVTTTISAVEDQANNSTVSTPPPPPPQLLQGSAPQQQHVATNKTMIPQQKQRTVGAASSYYPVGPFVNCFQTQAVSPPIMMAPTPLDPSFLCYYSPTYYYPQGTCCARYRAYWLSSSRVGRPPHDPHCQVRNQQQRLITPHQVVVQQQGIGDRGPGKDRIQKEMEEYVI